MLSHLPFTRRRLLFLLVSPRLSFFLFFDPPSRVVLFYQRSALPIHPLHTFLQKQIGKNLPVNTAAKKKIPFIKLPPTQKMLCILRRGLLQRFCDLAPLEEQIRNSITQKKKQRRKGGISSRSHSPLPFSLAAHSLSLSPLSAFPLSQQHDIRLITKTHNTRNKLTQKKVPQLLFR